MKTQQPEIGLLAKNGDRAPRKLQGNQEPQTPPTAFDPGIAEEEADERKCPSSPVMSIDQIIKEAKIHPGLRRRATISHFRILRTLQDIPENPALETEDVLSPGCFGAGRRLLGVAHGSKFGLKELRRHSFDVMSWRRDEQAWASGLEAVSSALLESFRGDRSHALSVPTGAAEKRRTSGESNGEATASSSGQVTSNGHRLDCAEMEKVGTAQDAVSTYALSYDNCGGHDSAAMQEPGHHDKRSNADWEQNGVGGSFDGESGNCRGQRSLAVGREDEALPVLVPLPALVPLPSQNISTEEKVRKCGQQETRTANHVHSSEESQTARDTLQGDISEREVLPGKSVSTITEKMTSATKLYKNDVRSGSGGVSSRGSEQSKEGRQPGESQAGAGASCEDVSTQGCSGGLSGALLMSPTSSRSPDDRKQAGVSVCGGISQPGNCRDGAKSDKTREEKSGEDKNLAEKRSSRGEDEDLADGIRTKVGNETDQRSSAADDTPGSGAKSDAMNTEEAKSDSSKEKINDPQPWEGAHAKDRKRSDPSRALLTAVHKCVMDHSTGGATHSATRQGKDGPLDEPANNTGQRTDRERSSAVKGSDGPVSPSATPKGDTKGSNCVDADVNNNLQNCDNALEQGTQPEAPKRKISVQVMRRSPIIFSVAPKDESRDKDARIPHVGAMATGRREDKSAPADGEMKATVSVSRHTRSAFVTFQSPNPGKTTEEVLANSCASPTGQRFAALSEKYASLTAKFAQGFGKDKKGKGKGVEPGSKEGKARKKSKEKKEETCGDADSKNETSWALVDEGLGKLSYSPGRNTEHCMGNVKDEEIFSKRQCRDINNNDCNSNNANCEKSSDIAKDDLKVADSDTRRVTEGNNEQSSDTSTPKSVGERPSLEKVWTTVERLVVEPVGTKSEDDGNPTTTATPIPDTAAEEGALTEPGPAQVRDEAPALGPTRIRTSILAKFMDRKLTRRRKQSIVPKAVQRKSKVYKTAEGAGADLPVTMAEFEAVRHRVDKTHQNGSLRSEALTIRVLLRGIDAALVERELVAVCKECAKTLRTLDALGSLPPYLSLDTVLINPSGTVKFKHLNTGVSIDNLFLAPDHNKKFASEKACVFSLAATIWSAADWHLTEAQKPLLSADFRDLLVSMTNDDPDVRIGLDDVLQKCEQYHSDGEMTSRERCQALLWEYQMALAAENEEALKNKASDDEKQARSQHDKLMGSISVAASVKGFLKETAKPQEKNALKTGANKQHTTGIRRNSQPGKPSALKTVGEKPIDPMVEGSPTKLATQENGKDTVNSAQSGIREPTTPGVAQIPPGGEEREGSQGAVLQQQGLSLTAQQKEKLMSILMSDRTEALKTGTGGGEARNFLPLDSQPVKDDQEHAGKAPTPPVDVLMHPEAQRLFTPIAPAGSPQGADGRGSQVSTPTLIPIPIAVSAVNAPPGAPMWYMPASVIPYGRPGSPYAQFVPIDPSAADASGPGPDSSPKAASRSDEPKKTRRHSPTPSRLPRPVWQTAKSGETTPRREGGKATPHTRERSVSEGSARAKTPSPSLGRRPASPSTQPRSQTPPVQWAKQSNQRPLRRSTGSMPSLCRSGSSSPDSRPDSPRVRRTSHDSTPRGSRSSSPVSALVSKFEDISKYCNEDPARAHSKSVSSLISKFGASSLVPEDRMTKGQFKPNVSPSGSQTSGRSGPLRPASVSESERVVDRDGPYAGSESTATAFRKSRNVYRTGSGPAGMRTQNSGESLSSENMQRLSESLEALFKASESSNTSFYEDDVAASSLANGDGKACSVPERAQYPLGDRRSLRGFSEERDAVSTVRSPAVHLNGGMHSKQELLETEPVRESVRAKFKPQNLVLSPEKEIGSHAIPSHNGVFQIPVNAAVMDSMNAGESSTPLISPLSPSPGFAARSPFFGVGTAIPERGHHNPASALSPRSLKDYKPTNFFKSVPRVSSMEPERDMNPLPGQNEEGVQEMGETRVKSEETPPSPGRVPSSPGNKEQSYMKRFERRVSKSGQSDKDAADARSVQTNQCPLEDGKSKGGSTKPPSPDNASIQPSDLHRAGSGKSDEQRSRTPTGRDFVAFSSAALTSESPRTAYAPSGEAGRISAKRSSLPQTPNPFFAGNSGKYGSQAGERRRSNPVLATKGVVTKTRSTPTGTADGVSTEQTSAKERPHQRTGRQRSAGGSATSRGEPKCTGGETGGGETGGASAAGTQEGRRPNVVIPHSGNTRTSKKHPSAPTTPTVAKENKVPELAFMRRQSSPATHTLGLSKNFNYKSKPSSNPTTPHSPSKGSFPMFSPGSQKLSADSLAHVTSAGSSNPTTPHSPSKGSLPMFSPGSQKLSAESLAYVTSAGNCNLSRKGSDGSETSGGSSKYSSLQDFSKKVGSFPRKEKCSPDASAGGSPLTSPPGSFSKSAGKDSLSPTRAREMFDYSPKGGSMDSGIFFNPKDTTGLGTTPRKPRIPSTSSSDSGITQSETDDSRSAFIRSETHSPVSPKFPTGLKLFYEPAGGRGPEKDGKVEAPPTKSVAQSTEDLSTGVRRHGSSEAQQGPRAPTKARHSSSSSEDSRRLLTKKNSSCSSHDGLKLHSLGDAGSARSGKTRHSSSSSRDGGDGSKKSARAPTSPRDQKTRPDNATALCKRPPSPGRIDSKELLGQLVKKVLTSAAAKQSASPQTSFSDNGAAPAKDRDKSAKSPRADKPVAERFEAMPEERRPRSASATASLEKEAASGPRRQSAGGSRTEASRAEPFLAVPGRKMSPSKEAGVVGSGSTAVESSPAEVSGSDEASTLSKLIDLIHDEFAFDGYLDDGVEDVNMAEYVLSLAGMSEENFKEAITDQYSDLYWDEDLLHDMYEAVAGDLQPKTPTLQFSESSVSDLSMPESATAAGLSREASSLGAESLYLNSVSRSSSERSGTESRDILMTSMGEPTEFLPIKIIAPEIIRDIQEELTPIFDNYHKEMNVKLASSIEELTDKLGTKVLEISQQLLLERRAKKKNINAFSKLADMDNKKDAKDLASKFLKEIEESDRKIVYLKNVQRRLRNVYCERFGLDISLLRSFVASYSKDRLTLESHRSNDFLTFSPSWDHRSSAGSELLWESTRGPNLQYGTHAGLCSYLFARYAMSQAFVRYFLYTFRYCATPKQLFTFIRSKCAASLRVDSAGHVVYNHQLQIRYRALDLLAEWIDGYYFYDFKDNLELVKELLVFVRDELILVDRSERGHYLVELISEKQKQDQESQASENLDTVAVLQMEDTQGFSAIDSPKDYLPRKHLGGKRKSKSPVQCFRRGAPEEATGYKATLFLKAMSVTDHSYRTLAEHLTLVQQDVFGQVHPIHFLNSRALGIGVGRGQSPSKERENIFGFSAGSRREVAGSEPTSGSPQNMDGAHLFVGELSSDGCLELLLEHAQDVSMWVAVEICSASSVKSQLALITKFVSIAKYCCEMRNFATCVQILDALEMFVVRQLPVWKHIPNKTNESLEELKVVKVLLKTDGQWLLKDDACRVKPTLPSVLLFLMHIQQQEIGGFTLANGMYKWAKMRSIARLIDQIRLFKQMRYAFEADKELKERLRARLLECKKENLHALAAENTSNFHANSSLGARKFQNTLKKVKATFGQG